MVSVGRKEIKVTGVFFTCGLLKHAVDAAHSPVFGQPLGRHLALHPALPRLPQRLIHARFPLLCGLRPVRGRLMLDGRIVQGLSEMVSREKRDTFKEAIAFIKKKKWFC